MSAAATAAGYLYASGRLRGRGAREQEAQPEPQQPKKAQPKPQPADRPVRVAVLDPVQEKPRRTPKIEYRVRRRWSPE
jgi:hypothetical protein